MDNITNKSVEKQTEILDNADIQANQEKEIKGKQTKRQQIESYLKKRFKFRYNELTGAVEYAFFQTNNWIELTDYYLNSICRQIDAEQGISISGGVLFDYLRSDYTPRYHPIKEYFNALRLLSGTENIDELINTISVKNDKYFSETVKRWLVACIANVFEFGCKNQTCLVLTGEQGAFKTTFLNLLCPKAISKYHFCGKIDLQSKDSLERVLELRTVESRATFVVAKLQEHDQTVEATDRLSMERNFAIL